MRIDLTRQATHPRTLVKIWLVCDTNSCHIPVTNSCHDIHEDLSRYGLNVTRLLFNVGRVVDMWHNSYITPVVSLTCDTTRILHQSCRRHVTRLIFDTSRVMSCQIWVVHMTRLVSNTSSSHVTRLSVKSFTLLSFTLLSCQGKSCMWHTCHERIPVTNSCHSLSCHDISCQGKSRMWHTCHEHIPVTNSYTHLSRTLVMTSLVTHLSRTLVKTSLVQTSLVCDTPVTNSCQGISCQD